MSPPPATLRAQTDAARSALGERDVVHLTKVPFLVGRESRLTTAEKLAREIERRIGQTVPVNDLYLIDRAGGAREISREHFLIEWRDGRFVLVDRGSTCGTSVAGRRLGKDSPSTEADLHDGDLIVVGTAKSQYVFRFEVGR